MATYSHSRISTFEQCKCKYKFQYIDKIKVDIPTTIEAFMGDLVHKSLEKLYHDLKFQKLMSKDEVLDFYKALWEEKWDDKILIAKKMYTPENYKLMGEKFISDYYNHYMPFDQMTILGLETQDVMLLPDGNHYHVRIDKLACVGNTYYVCDYKTNSSMKAQEEADSDRQLAMYSIWVKDRFKDAEKVVLLWHMLAFDKVVTSIRTEDELQKLQDQTVSLINQMETCKSFPANVSVLCNYCVFKDICPAFTHKKEIELKSQDEILSDEGVKLVDELTSLEILKKETEDKIDNLKKKIIFLSKAKNASIIYGTDKKASIREGYRVIYPEDKEELIQTLKRIGVYDEYSSLNYLKLSPKIVKGDINKEIINLVKLEKDHKLTLSKNKE